MAVALVVLFMVVGTVWLARRPRRIQVRSCCSAPWPPVDLIERGDRAEAEARAVRSSAAAYGVARSDQV